MSATAAPTSASGDLGQTITHLSQRMQVPACEIEQIYRDEFTRLAAQARIQTFVGLLAIGRARTLLHQKKSRPRADAAT